MIVRPLVLALALACAAVPALAGPVEDTIAKARAHLGGDAALSAVNSLLYSGTFTTAGGQEGRITITLQKPARQRLEVVLDNVRRVTAVNDLEAWEHYSRVDAPDQWNLSILTLEDYQRLRANSWENLHFFKDTARIRGTVEDRGRVTIDGREAHLLAFRYFQKLEYLRYFDPETGQLLVTVNDLGQESRETGEQLIAGIRFPRELINSMAGKEVMRVVFDRVEVNPSVDPKSFEIPSVGRGAPRP